MVPDSSCHKMWALEKMDELDAFVFPYPVHTSGYMICRIQARRKSVTSHGKCQPITPTIKGNTHTHLPKSPSIPIIHYPFLYIYIYIYLSIYLHPHERPFCSKICWWKKGKRVYDHLQRHTSMSCKNFQWDKSPGVPCIYIPKVPQSIYCVSFSIDQPAGFHTKTPRPTTKIEFTAPRSYQPPQGKSAWGPLENWEEFIEEFAKRVGRLQKGWTPRSHLSSLL